MRSFRLLGAFVALALVASLSMAFTSSPATAAPAKERHVVKKLKAGEIRDSGRFYARGKAVTYTNKRVKLLKAKNKNAKYRGFKSGRTNARGIFRITFDGPVGSCYKIVVPGTKRYKPFKRVVGCIIRQ